MARATRRRQREGQLCSRGDAPEEQRVEGRGRRQVQRGVQQGGLALALRTVIYVGRCVLCRICEGIPAPGS